MGDSLLSSNEPLFEKIVNQEVDNANEPALHVGDCNRNGVVRQVKVSIFSSSS